MFQNSVLKYFQSLLVYLFSNEKKAQRYVSKPTNSVWMKQLSLVEAKPELNLQQKAGYARYIPRPLQFEVFWIRPFTFCF